MDTYPMGVRYFNRLMWHGGCSTIHLPMLRKVLGLACLDERRGYAARLSPLLALVHRLPLLLDSPGQSALADVMRLLLMGDLLRQGSPISLRRETTTRPVRHHISS